MFKKNNVPFFVLICICFFSCSPSKNDSRNGGINDTASNEETADGMIDTSSVSGNYDDKYSYRVFYAKEKTRGFGYELFVNNKRIVYQPTIPAIAGYKRFKTKEDAQKIAMFAIQKMVVNGGSFPIIEVKELDSLGISY